MGVNNMDDIQQAPSAAQAMPTVPTYGNWAEERGFGQQTSPVSDSKQYDLKLTDPPKSNGK